MEFPFIRIIILVAIVWFLIHRSQQRRKQQDSALKMSKKAYVKKYGTETDKRENFKLANEWTEINREEKDFKKKK